MNTIRIYDFEDSFTYNIATSFFKEGNNPLVSHFTKLEADLKNKKFSNDVFVLGPGPGRPEMYISLYELIKKKIYDNYKFLGICLGHQIILNSLGYPIRISNKPIHGFSEKITLNKYWKDYFLIEENEIEVQRYNSLEIFQSKFREKNISTLVKDNIIYASVLKNSITYQFHPESIGTVKNHIFFSKLLNYKR